MEEMLDTPIHFFKIILRDTINATKLGIPPSFVKKHGYALQSSPIYLQDPIGNKWEIELSKGNDGEVWFKKGWQQFAKYYALDYGYFLIFRFEGSSCFGVVILDKTGTEIDYPIYSNLVSIRTPDVVEIGSSKRMRKARADNLDEKRFNNLRAIEEANKLVSESKYHSFKLVIKHNSRNIPVPALCYSSIFTQFEHNKDVTLKVAEVADKSWKVNLLCYKDIRVASFSAGWNVFARENHLKDGDVCAFELIEKDVLQVTIIRGS